MKKLIITLCLMLLCIVVFNSRIYAAFIYDIDSFTQNNGTGTFNDTFSDGAEPQTGSIYQVRPYGSSTTFGSNRESGGLLELNSDDAEVFQGDNIIGAFVTNSDYFFSSGAGGSVTGAFEVNNGFFANTFFSIDIENFEVISGTVSNATTFEDVIMGIYTDQTGSNFAVWGDSSSQQMVDISAALTGITDITLELQISTTNQVTAMWDYGSDGINDLTRNNFLTLSFTPGDSNDVYSGGFAAGETAPIPEPATIALLGIGLVGLAGAEVRRRRKKKAVDG